MPKRVLVVEDDDAIARPLQRALEREGYDVTRMADGGGAVKEALSGATDLVLLDLGLPDVDGIDVCRQIRDGGSNIPILMVTARGGELDRVVGLDSGADDYLPKPFGLAELMARIRALLRRCAAGEAVVVPTSAPAAATTAPNPVADGLRVDEASRRVLVRDVELHLTPKEFEVLALLHRERGSAVKRERLMDEIWDTNWFGSTKTLDVTVARVRQKLDEAGSLTQIVTLRGVGFRLEP